MSREGDLLMERLVELLEEAWPGPMTSTQLAELSGCWHSTDSWCREDQTRCLVFNPRPHMRDVVHHAPTAYRSAADKDGTIYGWDTYLIPVNLQQVNPALNKLHKMGRVEKRKPQAGSRSVLWVALGDKALLQQREDEALAILQDTLARSVERARREREERESRLLINGVQISLQVPEPEPPEPEPEPEQGFFERLVFC